MAKKHVSKSNAQRCREYRKRQRLIRDSIEKNLDEHIKKLREKEAKEKAEGKKFNIVDHYEKLQDSGRNPERFLVNQYEPSGNEGHFSLFDGSSEGDINPISKLSYQQQLKREFDDRAE